MKKIKEFISWVIAAGGLIVSIIGLASRSDFGKCVVFTVIIIDSLILVSLGIYVTMSYLKNRTALEKKDKEISEERHNLKDLEIKFNNQKKAYLSMNSSWNAVANTLQVYLTRLFDLTYESMDGTEAIKKEEADMLIHNYKMTEVKSKTVKMASEKDEKIAKDLYDDYKRFLSDVLGKTQDNVEKYLQLKGYDLEVSVTIKQLIKPAPLSKQAEYTSEPCIYTAFRDSKTWKKRIRKEVVQKLYTLNKNSDFIHCLTRGYYVFNNKNRNSRDYSNENTEFDKYYNCGATTLVSSPQGNLDNFVYGFIACDVLNTLYGNVEIMDTEVTTILETAAHVIAAYFDSIDFNWPFCQISDAYSSFWEMLNDNYVNKCAIKQY